MGIKNRFDKIRRRDPGELALEAFKKCRAALRWEFRRSGRAHRPYALSFWLTRRCNYQCAMCWVASSHLQEGDDYLRAGEELTLPQLRAVVDDAARWRPRVGVTGGEPFLRRDCLPFLEYVKSNKLRGGVNTNGTFLSRDASALVEMGLDSVMVSIDGPPAVHDAQRRSPGSFEKARTGVAALLTEKAKRRSDIPYIKITCTITNENVHHLADAADQFRDLAIDEFTFQHLWFTDQATADAQRNLFATVFNQDTTYLQGFVAPVIPPVDAAAVKEAMAAVRARSFPFTTGFYPALQEEDLLPFYAFPHYPFRHRCFSRWLRLDITPWGEVTPCLGLVVGDVRERPLHEIWNGVAYRRFRRELSRRKLFPGCNRCCGLFSD